MAYNFSAHQFEKSFKAKNLCNWEVPKWYPPRPRQRKCTTKIIADNRGHLLPNVKRTDDSPWGYFKTAHELPRKITRATADEINRKLTGRDKWKHFENKSVVDCKEAEKSKFSDSEYLPGDITPYDKQEQHIPRNLLPQKNYERNNSFDEQHRPPFETVDSIIEKYETESQKKKENTPSAFPIINNTQTNDEVADDFERMHLSVNRSITEKPNERSPSPIIPAFTNFHVARKMHQENLDHQPLPDCVADKAFRKLQTEGIAHPGLALNINPIATGVGVKTYNAGPTHCTKMKIYRPKTCGVVPKVYGNDSGSSQRPFSSIDAKKMGAMDLAICWDYRPVNQADEPKPSRHIDGSNDSAGPAVFTCVKTPRTPEKAQTGHSAGVFGNTFGELGFFEKDIMRRKTNLSSPPEKISSGRSSGIFRNTTEEPLFFDKNIVQRKSDFGQNYCSDTVKCTCGTNWQQSNRTSRAKSVSRNGRESCKNDIIDHKRYLSSPNLSVLKVNDYLKENEKPSVLEQSYRKYLSKKNAARTTQPGFFKRTARMCHKVAPQLYPEHVEKEDYKPAFRAGIPKFNAAGTVVSSDSGCSSASCCSNKAVVVPRPRNPYSKKNYDIETLVPPFTSLKGGAGQGGYPEHWRLASVYQHAYKPMEQRKRPLLQTVYK